MADAVVILPIPLYGRDTWSFILREERRPKEFEKRVLRRIFGPRRDEVTGESRKLYNKELNELYSSPDTLRVITSRGMRWLGHVASKGERRGAYRSLVENPEEKRTLGIPTYRWKYDIKINLQEMGWSMDWIDLAQDRKR
jgi:hypothetical protein